MFNQNYEGIYNRAVDDLRRAFEEYWSIPENEGLTNEEIIISERLDVAEKRWYEVRER